LRAEAVYLLDQVAPEAAASHRVVDFEVILGVSRRV
jgi:hypothetical protein